MCPKTACGDVWYWDDDDMQVRVSRPALPGCELVTGPGDKPILAC